MKKNILLFLDYDGTLTKIRNRPELAKLTAGQRRKIRRLTMRPELKVVIISGRRLSVLKKMVGLKKAIYIGNHGFEIEVQGKVRLVPGTRRFFPILKKIKLELAGLTQIKGVWLEDKGPTLSVHYRQVRPKAMGAFHRQIRLILAGWQKKIKVTHGKAVYEVRPPLAWDKGRAVLWLIKELKLSKYFPVYIGDDRTDEDAFRALKGSGRTYIVNPKGRSAADRRLSGIRAVYLLLRRIEHGDLKEKGRQ